MAAMRGLRLRSVPAPAADTGARIFLSHSSEDSAFVERLALDLIQRGYRVWLDAWHMGVGEHLTQSVRRGVETAAFLLVVLSPHTATSRWVRDELDWGLARERERGRIVLLPVRIGGGTVPRQASDRLYADFSGSYADGLAQLDSRLRSLRPRVPAQFDVADVDVPVFLDDGLDVDVPALGHCLDRQLEMGWPTYLLEALELDAAQVHLQRSKTYDGLRRSALSRVNDLTRERLSSAERQSLSLHARRVVALESHLLKGVAKLLSVGIPLGAAGSGFSASYACQGFVLLQRARILMTFFALMSEADRQRFPNVLSRCHLRPMTDADSAALVYGLGAMLPVRATPAGLQGHGGHHVFIPADSREAREVVRRGRVVLDDSVESMWLLSRFVVPQAIDASDLSDVEKYGGHALAHFPRAWDGCLLSGLGR